nr:hypothetical protein [Clostridiales bacterium]
AAMVEKAKMQADDLLTSARQQAEDTIVKAKARAQELKTNSEKWAFDLRSGASSYAEEILRRTDSALVNSVNEVRGALSSVQAAKDSNTPPAAEDSEN